MATATKEALYDVLFVNIKTGIIRAVSERAMTRDNADAYIKMAVYRRGVEEEFYAPRPHGQYKIGDKFGD